MQDYITVCFYKGGSWNVFDLIVRWDTKKEKQKFSEVPAHCSIVIQDTLYEYISTGFHVRPSVPEDLLWSKRIPVNKMEEAIKFLETQKGKKYGFLTIAVIGLARLLPDKLFKGSRTRFKFICAWVVEQTLLSSGWVESHILEKQYIPLSPNDIWYENMQTVDLQSDKTPE